MNPLRTGRAVLFFLPYVLVVFGFLVAGQEAANSRTHAALQALAVAAVGLFWACLRARRSRN